MSKKMIVMIVVMLGVTAALFFCSTEKVVHDGINDKDKYHQFAESSRNGQLLVFPLSIPDDVEVKGYYYSSNIPPVLSAKYQIYLNLQFSSDEGYKKEISRLSGIKKGTDTGATSVVTTKDIGTDKDNFNGTAYVAMLGYKKTYEYAFTNEKDKTIVYVYIQSIDKKDLKFDEKYLPKNYGDVQKSFSIYD